MKKANSSAFLRFVIGFICAILLGSGIFFAYMFRNKPTEIKANEKSQEALASQVLGTDLENDYPKSPEEVLKFYQQTIFLLYDENFTDQNTLKLVLQKQREIYLKQLLDLNESEAQFVKFISEKEQLGAKGIKTAGYENVETVYKEDKIYGELAIISTIQKITGDENLFFNYYFAKDDNERWKLVFIEKTDGSFASS